MRSPWEKMAAYSAPASDGPGSGRLRPGGRRAVCRRPGRNLCRREADYSGLFPAGLESDWRIANSESFVNTFTRENGLRLLLENAQQKQENQLKAIRKFVLQDVDYIVVAPIVESGWDSALQEAKNAGIPVILADRMVDADESHYTCYVGGNFVKEGKKPAGGWRTI